MGVYGLWKLIEPSGKPVPLDTLENKVLAVDVSIWLHQAVKGFQDSRGGTVPNAHLLGIYHRVCKLLYYKIKPVFVFDGGIPVLKKQTIAKRQQLKAKNLSQATSIQQKLISTLLKHSAITKVLSERTRAELEQQSASGLPQKIIPKDSSNIYALQPSQLDSSLSDEEVEIKSSSETDSTSPSKSWDLHTIDVKSEKFKSLPAETRHEILTELKETRKQNSWGRLHELPTHSDEFSGFQMNRLLNRYSVQVSLEEVEKEMGGHSLSLKELEALLKDTGVICNNDVGKRIASDENQKILFIKNVQEALKIANEIDLQNKNKSEELEDNANKETASKKLQDELEQDLQTAIKLSLNEQPCSSQQVIHDVRYFSSSEDEEPLEEISMQESSASSLLSSAKNYMTEYSGLTPSEINNIINQGSRQIKAGRLGTSTSSKSVDLTFTLETNEDMDIQKALEDNIKANIHIISENSEDNVTKSKDLIHAHETIVSEKDNSSNVKSSIFEEATIEKPRKSTSATSLSETVYIVEEIASDDSSSSDFVEVEQAAPEQNEEAGIQLIVDKTDDNIFKDVVNNKNTSNRNPAAKTMYSQENNDKGDNSGIEILVEKNYNVEVEDDLFSDIFVTNNDKGKDIQLEQSKVDNNSSESVKESHLDQVDADLNVMINSVQCDSSKTLSKEELEDLKDKMIQQKNSLYSERGVKERMAENISDQMYKDAQELLTLFGVPYIVAPMEAEAQCAFLETIGLTDGSITDDSDIWLFGGKTVYKNFFNQGKLVLEFRSDNIEHHFRLSREQLILLAMLVGSDYTTGIPGVGPVTALEILAAFPVSKNITFSQIARSPQQILTGLVSFRKWFINGKSAAPQKAGLRTKLKNCNIAEGFPNFQILNAYLKPEVDTSEEKFSWAKPDDLALIDFAKLKFGWTNDKAEEILKPVLKRMTESKVQKSVKDYFKTTHKLIDRTESMSKMSKRVKNAIDKLDGNGSDSLSDEELRILKETKVISKRKTKTIENNIRSQIDQASTSQPNKCNKPKKPRTSTKIRFERSSEPPKIVKPNLHKIDVIYQKEIVKNDLLQNKLKAIETFRKSKAGPGYVKKRKMVKVALKDEADLSENSDSN